jgi:ribonuclease H / adenosylcobalamin/alpha-ribazole phosphatase
MSRNLIVEADGGSRGNPGPSGSGAVVIDSQTGELLAEISKFIGITTNNVAEYSALITGLKEAFRIDSDANVLVRMDSKLVIEQMGGGWKIKHPDMQQLAIEAHQVIAGRTVTWEWIPREQNFRADALANKAMDDGADEMVLPAHSVASVATEFNHEKPSSFRSPVIVDVPATTLFFVRHGRTALTEARRISGGTGEDPRLSQAGRGDALAAAKAIGQIGRSGPFSHLQSPVVVVCSPMQRTRETAEAIAAEIGASIEIIEELREISFGDWDGLTNDEVKTKHHDEFTAWQGSWEASPPNGESLAVFDQRVSEAKRLILERHEGASVVVVAHVMPIRGFVSQALEAGVSAYWRTQISPCSITGIRLWGNQEAEVQFVNYTQHLG